MKQHSFSSSSSLHLWVLQKFQTHIAQWCKTTDKILLAVSGGRDSMAMLHLFIESGFSVAVAHVNFQLRGAESDEDERWLATYCKKKMIPFHSTRFDTNNYAIAQGLSIQMAARQLRYLWFKQLQEEQNFDWVATAHHQNDMVETVLLNISRGTSLHGLQGIAAAHGYLLRPLLFATRNELQAYVEAKAIPWREDQSNQTDDYQRNFIRHQIIPQFQKINPSFEASIAKTINKLQGTLQLIAHTVNDWKKQYVKKEGTIFYLKKSGLNNHPSETYNVAMLWEFLKDFGFHYDQCFQILKGINGQSGKKFLTTTHLLMSDRDALILKSLPSAFTELPMVIQPNQIEATHAGHTLTIEKNKKPKTITSSKTIALLDAQHIQFPITWRNWKHGDTFVPLGMKNHKKVSNFLIDTKVSIADKDSITVLESAGQIVWIVGHRIDDRFKVTDATTHVLILHLKK